jgi:hypothetical protein
MFGWLEVRIPDCGRFGARITTSTYTARENKGNIGATGEEVRSGGRDFSHTNDQEANHSHERRIR